MILYFSLILPIGCLLFAFYAKRNAKAMWFWHDPIGPDEIDHKAIKTFNQRVSQAFYINGIIFFIPTLLYHFHLLKEHEAFTLLCVQFTICFLFTMFFWHHLYKKYKA